MTHRRDRSPGTAETRAVAILLVALVGTACPPLATADKAAATLTRYNKRVDRSIDKALAYLAKQQDKEGVFVSPMQGNAGITSLCVMAFLAKGHTPGNGPYGEVINKGIDVVLRSQQPNGMVIGPQGGRSHGPMYSHAIATLLLSEVSGMVDRRRQKEIDKVLPKGLKVLLAAQQVTKEAPHRGGWRYQPHSTDSDISCSGWALMALRSARGNGARVPKDAIDKALGYVMLCKAPDGGFCYQPGKEPGLARTGTAVLCLELCGRHGQEPSLDGGKWILDHLHDRFGGGGGHFYYGLYYCSQAMFQLGGAAWQQWATHMYEMMLQYQRADGSWPEGSGTEGKAGSVYATAMSVLAMSVSYRQLPIYQR